MPKLPPRAVLFLVYSLGIFSTGAIFMALLWITQNVDLVERERTKLLVDLKISQTFETLRLGTEDYAHWTFAYELVMAGDDAEILDNIGSGATQSDLFDQIFILDEKGELLHAFDSDLGEDADQLFDQAVFGKIWTALDETPAQDYTSIVSIAHHQGLYAIVVATRLTPDDVVGMPGIRFPAFFGVTHLNDDQMAALVEDAQITTAQIGRYIPKDIAHGQRLDLFDFDQTPVATVTWTMQSTGAQLRKQLLPSLLLVGLVIIIICAAVGHFFQSQHKALSDARKVATTDQLTGLMNRAGLLEKLDEKLFSNGLENGHLAAIYIDLNDFKKLNDTFGHRAGDIALSVIADRLQSAVRSPDLVARLGGDEFVCVIVDNDPKSAAVVIAQRIIDLAATSIVLDGQQKRITASVGIATAAPGTRWETLLSQSDMAMFFSKQKKANYPVIFRSSMGTGNQAA
jgi:diguanylate cyclase (GGDEF)-like protein